VAAGDIGTKGDAVTFLADAFKDKPVIFVPGNHDHWGSEYYSNLRKMKDAAEGTNVHFFYDGGTIEIDGIVFCASTLWTDFALLDNQASNLKNGSFIMNDYLNVSIKDRRAYKIRDAMHEARDTMNDFRKIRLRRGGARFLDAPRDIFGQLKLEVPRRLLPQDVLSHHKVALANIEKAMIESYATYKKLVVVSHHAPSLISLTEGLEGSFLPQRSDPFYASNLDYLMLSEMAPVAWIHGHTHIAISTKIGDCILASNPKGYAVGDETGWHMGACLEI
jgi:Icc-related predicted phosphoesterase